MLFDILLFGGINELMGEGEVAYVIMDANAIMEADIPYMFPVMLILIE